jgi:hypothetical protein
MKFSKTKEVPISEIKTRKELFQGRQQDFSKETYDKIMNEGFDKSQDPIIVWKDSNTKDYIVISGHSRLAAAQKLYNAGNEDLAFLPVKEFNGNLEEAIRYAVLESNRSGTAEGLISDVLAYQKAVKDGCNKDCLKGYFKTDGYINSLQRLSYLDTNGDFLKYLNDSSEAKNFANLQKYAEWTGDLRKFYPQITNKHEAEIFDFLFFKSKKLLRKDEFAHLVEKAVNHITFNSNKPLNLANFHSKSVYEMYADSESEILNKEIEDLRTLVAQKQKLLARTENPEKQKDIEQEISGANRNIVKKLEALERVKENAKWGEQNQFDLFAEPNTPLPMEEPTLPKTPKEDKKEGFEDGVKTLNKVIEIDEKVFEPFDKKNYKEFSSKVNAFLKQYWRSEKDFDCIKNIQSGFDICFDNTGISELSEARRGEAKMKALSQIKSIIEDAILFTVREDKKNDNKVLAVYTFLTYIKYKEKTYEYYFTVKHRANAKFIYSVSLNIKKPLN